MKKLMLLGAMVAALVVAAAPAFAQIDQPFSERNNKSGTASPKTEVSNTGNNVSLCPTVAQDVNTGNVLNEQGANQYKTRTDDIDFSASEISVTPSGDASCTTTIKQTVGDPKGVAKAGGAEAKAAPASPAAKTSGAPQLPATGGMSGSTASLLGLGAGALLVAGGLIARRILR